MEYAVKMKKVTKILLTIVMAAIVCFGFVASAGNSEPSKVTDLNIKTNTTSVTLTWDKSDNTNGYRVFVRDTSANKWKTLKNTDKTSYVVTGLEPGTSYTFAVRSYNKVKGNTVWCPTYAKKTVITNPETLKTIKATSTTDSITLSWKKAEGATHYRIYKYNTSTKNWEHVVSQTSKTSYTFKNIKSGTKIKYSVKPFAIVGKTKSWASSSTKITIATQPLKPTKVTAKSTDTTVTLSWPKSAGATGYRIYKYNETTKKWVRALRYTHSLTATITNLEPGTKHIFAVKPYISTGAIENGGSSTIWCPTYTKITTATKPEKVTGLSADASPNKIKLSWNKIDDSVTYAVFSYNSTTKKYSKISETNSTNYTVSNLRRNTTYKYAVQAYITINGTKYWSKISSILTASTTNDEYYYNENGDKVLVDENGIETIVKPGGGSPGEWEESLRCSYCGKPQSECVRSIRSYYCGDCKKTISSGTCHPSSHFDKYF